MEIACLSPDGGYVETTQILWLWMQMAQTKEDCHVIYLLSFDGRNIHPSLNPIAEYCKSVLKSEYVCELTIERIKDR